MASKSSKNETRPSETYSVTVVTARRRRASHVSARSSGDGCFVKEGRAVRSREMYNLILNASAGKDASALSVGHCDLGVIE